MIADVIAGLGVLVMSGNLFISWKTRKHVGATNGNGTLADMLEHTLVWQEDHALHDDERFQRIEDQIAGADARAEIRNPSPGQ